MGNNLDRGSVEKLLETMEPSEIREAYGSRFGDDPQIESLLNAFESLDDNLGLLKSADPPPAIPKPIYRGRFGLFHAVLPMAAVMLIGFLFWFQKDEISLQAEKEAGPATTGENLGDEPAHPIELLARDLSTDGESSEETVEAPEARSAPPTPVLESEKSRIDRPRTERPKPSPMNSEFLESPDQPPEMDAGVTSKDDRVPERKTKIYEPPSATRQALPERELEEEIPANPSRAKKRTQRERLPTAPPVEDVATRRPPSRKTSSALLAGTESLEERAAESAVDQMDRELSPGRESYIVQTKPTAAQQETAAKRWLDLFNRWQQGQESPHGLFSDRAMVQWPRAVLPPGLTFDPEAKPQVRLWYRGLDQDRGILLGWEPTANQKEEGGTLLLVLNGLGECIRLTRL